MGQNDKCKEIIESIDWSASGDLFKLGSLILKDDFDSAAAVMKDIGNNPKILGDAEFNDWPIFKVFRKTDHFKAAYSEIYGKEYQLTEEQY